MGKDMQKVPKLRLKEFNDSWELHKLGELADIVGGGTPDTKNPTYWGGKINWYSPAEIGDQICVSSSQRKITKEGYANCSAKMLPAGTVLFTSRAGIGKTAILATEACTNQGFQSIVPHKEALDSYFMFSRTNELKEYGETIGAGSTFAEVSGKQMAEMKLLMPKSKDEQQRIGYVFRNIDSLITLQQRKLSKLQDLKKALLAKMFPTEGESMPAVRFKGFTDAWEQRKLGELMPVGSVKRVHQEDWRQSGIRFLRARDIVAELKNEEVEDKLYISENQYDEYTRISGKVAENDLLVTGVGTIGVPYRVKDDKPLYFKDGNIIWFKNSNVIDGRFFFYSFLGKTIQNHISNSAGVGTVGTYTIESGKDTPIFLPSHDEQESIGLFFERIDTLITLHQRKLSKLKDIKKALLNNMFPGGDI